MHANAKNAKNAMHGQKPHAFLGKNHTYAVAGERGRDPRKPRLEQMALERYRELRGTRAASTEARCFERRGLSTASSDSAAREHHCSAVRREAVRRDAAAAERAAAAASRAAAPPKPVTQPPPPPPPPPAQSLSASVDSQRHELWRRQLEATAAVLRAQRRPRTEGRNGVLSCSRPSGSIGGSSTSKLSDGSGGSSSGAHSSPAPSRRRRLTGCPRCCPLAAGPAPFHPPTLASSSLLRRGLATLLPHHPQD